MSSTTATATATATPAMLDHNAEVLLEMPVLIVERIERFLIEYSTKPTNAIKQQLRVKLANFKTPEVQADPAYLKAFHQIAKQTGSLTCSLMSSINGQEKMRVAQIEADQKIAELPAVLALYKVKLSEKIVPIQKAFEKDLATLISQFQILIQRKMDQEVSDQQILYVIKSQYSIIDHFHHSIVEKDFFFAPTNPGWIKIIDEIEMFKLTIKQFFFSIINPLLQKECEEKLAVIKAKFQSAILTRLTIKPSDVTSLIEEYKLALRVFKSKVEDHEGYKNYPHDPKWVKLMGDVDESFVKLEQFSLLV
jgi:hypothetical protein